MEKVIIYATPDEIAEALKLFLENYKPKMQEPVFEKEKMTVAQGSHYIGISYQTLCNWINSGSIPVHGKGRKRFLLKSELVEAYKNLH